MTTYESEIKTIHSDIESAYGLLSDLRNLEQFKNRFPSDKIQEIEFDMDSCHFSISPIGRVGLRILEREAPKTIKFGAENSPVQFNLWIQLKALSENDTKMRVTMKADLPLMIKTMVGGKIQDFVNMFSEALCNALNTK